MTDSTTTILTASILAIIAGLSAAIVKIINALTDMKKALYATGTVVQVTKEQNDIADKKLNKVIMLVDGPLKDALHRIASRDETIAATSGSDVDAAAAVESRQAADVHAAHSDAVIASTDALTAATEARKSRRDETLDKKETSE